MSFVDPHSKTVDIQQQNRSMMVPNSMATSNHKANSIQLMTQTKTESKDHKWKEAPILGI